MQWREFGLLYLTYMGFLLSRKNYGFWLRSVISDLGYEKSQAGLLGSTLEITYGACSFLNGVVVRARSRARAHTPSPMRRVLAHLRTLTGLPRRRDAGCSRALIPLARPILA